MFRPDRIEVICSLVVLVVILAAFVLWSNEPPCKHHSEITIPVQGKAWIVQTCNDR